MMNSIKLENANCLDCIKKLKKDKSYNDLIIEFLSKNKE
jgi:hypothetical protein